MDKLLDFFGNHYILFTFLAVVSLFALIGYLINLKTKEHEEFRFEKEEDTDFSNLIDVSKAASLSELVNNNANNHNQEVGIINNQEYEDNVINEEEISNVEQL